MYGEESKQNRKADVWIRECTAALLSFTGGAVLSLEEWKVWKLGEAWLIFIQASTVSQKLSLETRIISTCSFTLISQSNAEVIGENELPVVPSTSTPDASHFIATLRKNQEKNISS